MRRNLSLFPGLMLAATTCCTSIRAASFFPNQVLIRAEHLGWSSASTNLTLTLSNGVYAAGTYTVDPAVISNLIAVATRPWPQPPTNAWPRFTLDLANLGLNAAWVRTNQKRLLEAFPGKSGTGALPNASERNAPGSRTPRRMSTC